MSAARKLAQIGPLPKLRAEELEFRVGAAQPNPSEVGPLYKAAYRTSRTQGLRVATALAKTLPDIDHHRQLFQAVALRPAKERRTLIDGYRKAEQDRWVVHAIGELPSAQGRALMKDFVLTETGKKDTQGAPRGAPVPRGSGATIKTRPVEDDPNDSAIVELVEDIVDAVKQAVDAVVDAIKNALKSIAEAFVAAVNFTVAQMANLAKALLAAGETIFNIVKGALEAAVADTLAFVKKVIQGIVDAGRAMFQVLNDIANLVGAALQTVLRAIDQLGHQLGELLSWMATQVYATVKEFAKALIAIGKTIGNLINQAFQAAAPCWSTWCGRSSSSDAQSGSSSRRRRASRPASWRASFERSARSGRRSPS